MIRTVSMALLGLLTINAATLGIARADVTYTITGSDADLGWTIGVGSEMTVDDLGNVVSSDITFSNAPADYQNFSSALWMPNPNQLVIYNSDGSANVVLTTNADDFITSGWNTDLNPGQTYLYGSNLSNQYTALTLNIETAPVPEPSSWVLLLTGCVGLGYLVRRRTMLKAVAAIA